MKEIQRKLVLVLF